MVSKEIIEVDAKPEVKAGEEIQRFGDLARALSEGVRDGVLPGDVFTANSLDESDLGERTVIAPDGVSLFKTGDSTLKSREILKVDLTALARIKNGSGTDVSLGSSLTDAAEELGLPVELIEKLQGYDESKARDEQAKAKLLSGGYSRGDWRDWSGAELTIVKTTKKDGAILMGALLGATTTTRVSLGGDHIDDDVPRQTGLYDTDDLWKDGMKNNHNVKVPLSDALSLVERLTLEQAQEAAA